MTQRSAFTSFLCLTLGFVAACGSDEDHGESIGNPMPPAVPGSPTLAANNPTPAASTARDEGMLLAEPEFQPEAISPGPPAIGMTQPPVLRASQSAAGSDAPSVVSELVEACPGQWLRTGIPADLTQAGPWPVGALTATVAGQNVEVWYPAAPGSADNVEPRVYDTRLNMPAEERNRIPDARNPVQPCNCYPNLPLDTEAGPYPVLLFIHGTAAFRTSNLENAVHWASRGFVVMAADHSKIQLCDMFAMFTRGTPCSDGPRDQAGQGRRLLTAAFESSGALSFLRRHIDSERVGVMGHSAGAFAAKELNDIVDVMVIYAASKTQVIGDRVQSVLFATGEQDRVARASTEGYERSESTRKRFVSLARGGHLVGGSLCDLRDRTHPTKNIVDLAGEFQLGGAALSTVLPIAFGMLFDGCNDLANDDAPFLNNKRAIRIVNGLTTGVFEEVLHCSAAAATGLERLVDDYSADIERVEESVSL